MDEFYAKLPEALTELLNVPTFDIETSWLPLFTAISSVIDTPYTNPMNALRKLLFDGSKTGEDSDAIEPFISINWYIIDLTKQDGESCMPYKQITHFRRSL